MPLEKQPFRQLKRPSSIPHATISKTNYHNLCLDAQRFVSEKDYTTALLIYEKALQEAPIGDQKALKGICRCYRKLALKSWKNQDFLRVQVLLEELMAKPKIGALLTAKDYFVLAEAAIENMDLSRAEQSLRNAFTLKPESIETAHKLQKRLQTEQLHQQMKDLYNNT